MKFEILTARDGYLPDDDAEKVWKLEAIGFHFHPTERLFGEGLFMWKTNTNVFTEMNSLEEMMDFVKEWGKVIVEPGIFTDTPSLTIYDGEVE